VFFLDTRLGTVFKYFSVDLT